MTLRDVSLQIFLASYKTSAIDSWLNAMTLPTNLEEREHCRNEIGHLDDDVVHVVVYISLGLHADTRPHEPPELYHVDLALKF